MSTEAPLTLTMSTAEASVLFDAEVIAVGPMVAEFVESGVLVLFGEQAPEELHEFAVLHRPNVQLAGPAPGDLVELGSARLAVLAVGDVVAQNLLQLGHLSLKADGRTEAAMPGDVCVPAGGLPAPAVGQRIRFLRPGPAGSTAGGGLP